VAVGMAFDAPGDERDALRDEQAAGAVLHYFTGALEPGERALEIASRVARHMEPRRELLARERGARRVQGAEDALRIGRAAVCPLPSPQRRSFRFFL
jgi:hypothetical protein